MFDGGGSSLATYLPPGVTYQGLDYSKDFVKTARGENPEVTQFNLHAANEVCGGRDWVYVLDK